MTNYRREIISNFLKDFILSLLKMERKSDNIFIV